MNRLAAVKNPLMSRGERPSRIKLHLGREVTRIQLITDLGCQRPHWAPHSVGQGLQQARFWHGYQGPYQAYLANLGSGIAVPLRFGSQGQIALLEQR